MTLLQTQHENNFLPTSKHWQANVRCFLCICMYMYLWAVLYDCFIYCSNFIFPKMYGNETPSGLLSHNSEWPRIFRFTGANQNVPKLIFTDLVNTNTGYCVRRDSNRKVLPPFNPPTPHYTDTDRYTTDPTQIQTDLHVTTDLPMAHTGLLTPSSPSTCLSTSGVFSYFMSQLSFPRSEMEKKFFSFYSMQ